MGNGDRVGQNMDGIVVLLSWEGAFDGESAVMALAERSE